MVDLPLVWFAHVDHLELFSSLETRCQLRWLDVGNGAFILIHNGFSVTELVVVDQLSDRPSPARS